MPDDFSIHPELATSHVATSLIAKLDADINVRYPGLPTHGIDGAGFARAGGLFAVGYAGGEPAACGALRRYENAGEIKRMYVAPAFRGRGFARRMLAFLEAAAITRGFERLVLETGDAQPEAIALYESCGFTPIPAYGEYISAAHVSLCFEKPIGRYV